MEAMTLAQQFSDMQVKQRERYKTRLTKLLHSNPTQQPPSDSTTDLPSDDLGLMTETQRREHGSLATSHEAENNTPAKDVHKMVESLHQQVEQLQLEKADLSSQLKIAEKKVATLQKTLQEEHEALGGGIGGIATTQKIVELSKKNRVLHAELAAERNRCRQMEKQMKAATPVQQGYVQEIRNKDISTDSRETESLQTQLTALQEQLAQCKHKITDYRNQCQLLKQDLKVAHRVIAKEVGPGMTVSELLNSPSGWRGRSQQIITLQNKMKSLLEKTSGRHDTADMRSDYAHGGRERGRGVEGRQKAVLEKMERERKQNLETARKELEKMQIECERAHKECHALQARNKTLTEDMKLLKSEGPSSKRNSAMPSAYTCSCKSNTQALELRVHKLEGANQLLKQQLQECEKELQKSQQKRPSTSTRLPSLAPLNRPPSSQVRAKSFPLSAHQLIAKGERYTMHEAQVLVQMVESERDKLLNLTLTLQRRLDNATDQLMRLKLEKSVGQKLPKFGQSGTKNGVKQKPRLDEKMEALEAEIVIQRDENAVLKDTLRQLRQEKLDDMRTFHDTLQDTMNMCVGGHLEIESHHQ